MFAQVSRERAHVVALGDEQLAAHDRRLERNQCELEHLHGARRKLGRLAFASQCIGTLASDFDRANGGRYLLGSRSLVRESGRYLVGCKLPFG